MDTRIQAFLYREHVLHLSTLEMIDGEFEIYCASCFYAFDGMELLFKSHIQSRHIQNALLHPKVGICIAKNTHHLPLIEGIQGKAWLTKAKPQAKRPYYERYPFARLREGEVFVLQILWLKYTNNSLAEKLSYTKKGD